jgi:hypothetical protein
MSAIDDIVVALNHVRFWGAKQTLRPSRADRGQRCAKSLSVAARLANYGVPPIILKSPFFGSLQWLFHYFR